MEHNEKKQCLHDGNCRKKRGSKWAEIIYKAIVPENFLSLGIEMNIHFYEAQRMSNILSPNKAASRHCNSVIKSQRQRILRTAREKREKLHTREPPQEYWLISQQKLFRPRENGMTFKILN